MARLTGQAQDGHRVVLASVSSVAHSTDKQAAAAQFWVTQVFSEGAGDGLLVAERDPVSERWVRLGHCGAWRCWLRRRAGEQIRDQPGKQAGRRVHQLPRFVLWTP